MFIYLTNKNKTASKIKNVFYGVKQNNFIHILKHHTLQTYILCRICKNGFTFVRFWNLYLTFFISTKNFGFNLELQKSIGFESMTDWFFICFSSSKFRVTHKPKNKYDVGGNIPTCFPINQDPAISSSNTYRTVQGCALYLKRKKISKTFSFSRPSSKS